MVVDVDKMFEHLAACLCRFFAHVHDDDQVDGSLSRNRTFSPKQNLSALVDSGLAVTDMFSASSAV
jgi:hypothetical protein